MPWISINPDSEPKPAVEAAAYIAGVDPENISSTELADVYNQISAHQNPSSISAEPEGNIDGFIDSISSLFDEEVED